jgi:two-component system sensor histidine kinase UhpB
MIAPRPLSLRLRVLAAIALVVIVGAIGGGAFAGWLARQTLRDELGAAMVSGRQAVERAFEASAPTGPSQRDLIRLVEAFNGDRHVSAKLVDSGGRGLAVSRPTLSPHAAPDWFMAFLDPRLAPLRLPAASGTIVLQPSPDADVGDAWLQFGDALAVLSLVGAAGVALVYVTIGQALRPLSALSAALGRVGAGDYAARVEAAGPAELARLAVAFNAMAADLEAMRRRTRVLEEQILKLQDEERAELARDLHDEIGPHLFAVNIDAAMLGQALAAGENAKAARQVKAIQTAVAHMQRQVRDILARLRPAQLVELGLGAAIGELAQFWRERRPGVEVVVDMAVDEARLSEGVQEVLYRIVQEGLNNAVRHGRPRRIDVVLRGEGEAVSVRVSDDGLGGQGAQREAGFGLTGMRERIEAVGGSLSVLAGPTGGWSIIARAPATSGFAFAEAAP